MFWDFSRDLFTALEILYLVWRSLNLQELLRVATAFYLVKKLCRKLVSFLSIAEQVLEPEYLTAPTPSHN